MAVGRCEPRCSVGNFPETVQGLTDIIVYGKRLSEVWLNAVVLLAFAAIYFAIGVRRLRLD